MAVARAEIMDAISNMSVLELSELIKEMEEKFDVSAAAATVSVAAPAAAGAAAAEEQSEFAVVLASYGENKVSVIKAFRAITALSLKEAKDLVEAAPKAVKEGVPKDEAEKVKAQIESAGGQAQIK